MFYDRQIRYIDYWCNKEKVGNAGYVKIEVREGIIQFAMRVTGLPPTDSVSREVYLTNGVKKVSIGSMVLTEGQGEFLRSFKDAQFMQDIFPYETLSDIRMGLSGNRELFCQWEEYPAQETYRFTDGPASGNRRRGRFVMNLRSEEAEETLDIPVAAELEVEEKEIVSDEQEPVVAVTSDESKEPEETGGRSESSEFREDTEFLRDDKVLEEVTSEAENRPIETADFRGVSAVVEEDSSGERNIENREKTENRDRIEETLQRRLPRYEPPGATSPRLYENKWDQLCFWYPTIHPFQDGREYLSVSPEDFVILQASYHKIVKNSFLLHGYYQYRHLVLTRVKRKGQNLYYIGVPGNYYEKEKQVAVYFGFVSFECQVEPAREGDFGYYMMPVQI